MAREPLNSLEDFERFLTTRLDRWSRAQRSAFAAGMADRWMPVYEAFSQREDWGDPASLHHSVDAVWANLRGQLMGPGDQARHLKLLHDSTPHMDDFDAPEALAVAVMVRAAVHSCAPDDSLSAALQASMSGFEAIVPDWSLDEGIERKLWQRGSVRKELERQLTMIDRIDPITVFDPGTIETLRRELRGPKLAGEIPRRKQPSSPPLRTNQDIFEQYRGIVELDNRTRRDVEIPGSSAVTMVLLWFSEWMGRYRRRLALLTGGYGKLADTTGQAALVRRQRAKDAAQPATPGWDQEVREMVDLTLANPMLELDVTSVDAPHGYGPSVRRLWAEAKARGKTDAQAWQHVVAWARHRPAVWDDEDRRKKKGLAHSAPALGDHLSREVTWSPTDNAEYPWAAEVDGARWRVRLNDFPDEILYSLIVGDTVVGDFHDWPESWRRS
jgi:uncharacterized protein YjaG (DUF416 family)